MSSRARIFGLAGFRLGVTTLATSKLVGAACGGGSKGFFNQTRKEIATPFKAIGKRFNPQLVKVGNQENKINTKYFGKIKEKSLNKKLGKVENKFTSKNSFSYLKPTTKREMKHNQKVLLQNLNEKQKRINKKLETHNDKYEARKKKMKRKSHKLKNTWQIF